MTKTLERITHSVAIESNTIRFHDLPIEQLSVDTLRIVLKYVAVALDREYKLKYGNFGDVD